MLGDFPAVGPVGDGPIGVLGNQSQMMQENRPVFRIAEPGDPFDCRQQTQRDEHIARRGLPERMDRRTDNIEHGQEIEPQARLALFVAEQ